jgi:hypothetical protein
VKVLPSPIRRQNYEDGLFTPQSANDSYRSQESKLTNSTAKSGMLNFTGNSRAPAPPVKNFVDEIDYIEDDAGNILDTFGENGTSITQFWLSQPQEWQLGYVNRFAIAMAQEIVNGTAE